MQQKSLTQTNPHLRDPIKFRKALVTSVASSTSIETGQSVASIAHNLENQIKIGAETPTNSKPSSAQ
jgi:hypothetical protein